MHVYKPLVRELGDPIDGPQRMALWSLPGILREYAGVVRRWEVGQPHITGEACEQGLRCAVIRGVGGGKVGWPRGIRFRKPGTGHGVG